jgi:hypothetical protein
MNEELLELLRRLRYDLTAAQGKLTDVMAAVSALDVELHVPRAASAAYAPFPHADVAERDAQAGLDAMTQWMSQAPASDTHSHDNE